MALDLFTLDFLAKNTSLPIPHVHASSCSLDNPLSRPYTLMPCLEGTPLGNLWFDPVWMTDQRRQRVFESLALAMSQLSSFTFPKIGDLVPDPETGCATIGPIYPSTEEISDEGATSEDALGPYDSTYDFLLDGIRRQSECANSCLAQLTLLRVFASSLPDDSYTSPPFVLAFPDYNYDNILVDGEGHVTGLLDWDSTFVGPRQVGFAHYPSWITRDWDPTCYVWHPRDVESPLDDPSVDLAPGGDGPCNDDLDIGGRARNSEQDGGHSEIGRVPEGSPQTLQRYRDEYLEIYAKVDPENAVFTKNSRILEAVQIGVFSEVSRGGIVQKLAEYMFGAGDTLLSMGLMECLEQGAWLKDLVGAKKLVSST